MENSVEPAGKGKAPGRAIAKLLEKDPELREQFQTRFLAIGQGLQILAAAQKAVPESAGRAISAITNSTADAVKFIHELLERSTSEGNELLEREMTKAIAEYQVKIRATKLAWQEKYGELYPTSLEEWTRWAARVGWDSNFIREGQWKPGDLMPTVEGYLLRLKDQRDPQENGLRIDGKSKAATEVGEAAGIPPEYRCDEKPRGEPLTTAFVGKRYGLKGHTLTRADLESIRSGRMNVYKFKDIVALAEKKNG